MKKRALSVKRRMPPLVQALLESSLLILFSVFLLVNLVQPAAAAKRVILRDPIMIAILTILLLLVFSLAIVLTSNYRRVRASENAETNLAHMAQLAVKSWIFAATALAAGIILITA